MTHATKADIENLLRERVNSFDVEPIEGGEPIRRKGSNWLLSPVEQVDSRSLLTQLKTVQGIVEHLGSSGRNRVQSASASASASAAAAAESEHRLQPPTSNSLFIPANLEGHDWVLIGVELTAVGLGEVKVHNPNGASIEAGIFFPIRDLLNRVFQPGVSDAQLPVCVVNLEVPISTSSSSGAGA
jgi:hypothetical protein